ncbi:MAG: HAD family phosphatase [Polyangiaceae bacterium]|nr:HAD family phosphatase [Polyangiaceae bacterium]
MLGVIFDCDGVLVDSERLSLASWLPVLARHGIPATIEQIEPFIGASDRAVLEHFGHLGGTPLGEDLLEQRQAEYFRMARGNLRTFPGVVSVLERLHARRVPMAVASSGQPEKIRFNLEQVELTEFFPVVVSSIEVERGKPAPDLFLLAARRLGLDPERCAVVEDSVLGVRAARSAGMLTLGYTSSYPATVLRQAAAHHVFVDYANLLPLLGLDRD